MATDLYDLGVGGVVAILVLREVFKFLSQRRNGTAKPDYALLEQRLDQVEERLRESDEYAHRTAHELRDTIHTNMLRVAVLEARLPGKSG